jgi:hypothetical protein
MGNMMMMMLYNCMSCLCCLQDKGELVGIVLDSCADCRCLSLVCEECLQACNVTLASLRRVAQKSL